MDRNRRRVGWLVAAAAVVLVVAAGGPLVGGTVASAGEPGPHSSRPDAPAGWVVAHAVPRPGSFD